MCIRDSYHLVGAAAVDEADDDAVLLQQQEALRLSLIHILQAGGETFRGRWLVGCDGGRSQVRKLSLIHI